MLRRRALDEGARILKVHLQVGGFPPDDPRLGEVWLRAVLGGPGGDVRDAGPSGEAVSSG